MIEDLSLEDNEQFNRGWHSYVMGKSINDCPYKSSVNRYDFMRGWIAAMIIEDFKNPLVNGEFRMVE